MVIMGKYIGFCKGVYNSVNTTIELLEKYKNVYALGMLVHNENVIKDLENKGIIFVDDINEVPDNSHIIFRAHGVCKEIYEKAKNKNLIIHDLTCPNVLKIHKIVQELNDKGYYIILCGNANHPESIGTISFCNGIVTENIENIVIPEDKPVALLCQTTISIEKFTKIKNYLLNIKPNILIYNTICSATKKREEEVMELSKMVDNLLVLGSSKSSNTKKLIEVSKCKNTYLVDDVDKFNIELTGKIGIVTGASTDIKDAIKLRGKYE